MTNGASNAKGKEMKKVYKVTLDGNNGYFRTVTRMSLDNIKKEAQRIYPTAHVTVELTDKTVEEARELNNSIIDGSYSFQ